MHEIIVYKKLASATVDIKSTTSTNDRPKQGRYLLCTWNDQSQLMLIVIHVVFHKFTERKLTN